GRVLAQLMPDEAEVHALLALMLSHESRRAARFTPDGELVLLEDQDRSRWDAAQLAEATAHLESALRHEPPRPYTLQAAIALAQTRDPIDWPYVADLYAELARQTRSPVVELNHAVAIAQAGAPETALELVDRLPLETYAYLHSTRAELLRRLG